MHNKALERGGEVRDTTAAWSHHRIDDEAPVRGVVR
jgi:hypothetical protein